MQSPLSEETDSKHRGRTPSPTPVVRMKALFCNLHQHFISSSKMFHCMDLHYQWWSQDFPGGASSEKRCAKLKTGRQIKKIGPQERHVPFCAPLPPLRSANDYDQQLTSAVNFRTTDAFSLNLK